MASSSPTDSLLWADRSLSLIDILKEADLPAIVKMKEKGTGTGAGARPHPASQVLQRPLLLYREVKGYKIVARNVSSLEAVPTSKGGVEYREGGSVIVIPVDYRGWFRVLDDNSVPVLNMANLARIMPVLFLSAKRFPCFSLLDPLSKKDFMYEKLFFPPGLYKVISVYEDYVKYKTEKNGTKKKLLRCLICESQDDIDVLVPFDVTGEFYIVEHKKALAKAAKVDTNARAYTLKQLVSLNAFLKPITMKLILGDQPNKPCGFTGIIKVVDIIQDWTVIAATLDGNRKMLELPVAPFPEFQQALNGKDHLESGALRSEYQYIQGGAADKYANEIKVREKVVIDKEDEAKRKSSQGKGSTRTSKSRELKPVKRAPKSPLK